MESAAADLAVRAERIDRIAADLIPRASLLTRLVTRRIRDMSRSEGTMLRSLLDGPRRITELAELEGLAQPTTTALINRLQECGWVQRANDPADGRVVLVSLTDAGAQALDRYRARYRATVADHLRAMTDEQLATLADAAAILGQLVADLQRDGPR